MKSKSHGVIFDHYCCILWLETSHVFPPTFRRRGSQQAMNNRRKRLEPLRAYLPQCFSRSLIHYLLFQAEIRWDAWNFILLVNHFILPLSLSPAPSWFLFVSLLLDSLVTSFSPTDQSFYLLIRKGQNSQYEHSLYTVIDFLLLYLHLPASTAGQIATLGFKLGLYLQPIIFVPHLYLPRKLITAFQTNV